MQEEIKNIIEYLSPNERAIIPHLSENSITAINEKTDLGETAILRALEFLSNKDIIKLTYHEEKIIELGLNGLLYVKQGLPERRLINLIIEKNSISLNNAKKETRLSDNEFKAAIGALKKRALINLVNQNIIINDNKEVLTRKTIEEDFLESLPKKLNELKDEEKFAFDILKSRKNIIDISEKKLIKYEILPLADMLMDEDLTLFSDSIESLTPAILKSNSWKGKKFRKYDITSQIPRINGGKRHFVNQSTEYAKKIWLEMGFVEMTGKLIQSSFWNFDALFTAQDHPVREMQDTFFIKDKTAKLNDKKIINEVKKAHTGQISGSKGWGKVYNENQSKKVLLRTHTTCLSIQKLYEISKDLKLPAKYFALGKCFRNETIDWSHGFEFNQTEGIVIDENANFTQLLGYLKEFFKKMGYEKIRIRPGYFPYTEPSLEIDAYIKEKGKWIELGGAGIFRPEVTIPIFGHHIPVLAWGPGFDRIIMQYYNITDLRDMYKNDINKLREMKIWRK